MEALLFLALVVPFIILVYGACLLFIRPSKVVFLTSLLAGLVMGVINLLVDIVAYYAHWWHYEFVQTGVSKPSAFQAFVVDIFKSVLDVTHVPLPFYLTPILIYGSLAYLLIWRFWFGKGRWFSILLLIGVPIFCIIRDVLGGLDKTSYQVWENIPLALVATIVLWLIAFYPGFLLFWRKAAHHPFVPLVDEHGEAGRQAFQHKPTPSH